METGMNVNCSNLRSGAELAWQDTTFTDSGSCGRNRGLTELPHLTRIS